jgi:shikimate kinase
MRIVITGPRSVGKSTVSKIVADLIKHEYVSSDELGNKAFEKQGGLDGVTKSGELKKIIMSGGYTIILDALKKDNFIFDLSGGSVSSRSMAEASAAVRKAAKESSIIFGILPSKDFEKSIKILSEREAKREHFKHLTKEEINAQTRKDFDKFPPLFEAFCDYIIYAEDKTPEEIAKEIVSKLNKK